jgi:ribonuclease HI
VTITQLEILQNNLHTSRERTHGILNDPDMTRYAILMLQEQFWDSTRTKSSPIHHAWTLIEPIATAPNDTPPRSAIYVNNNIISPSQITPLAFPFSDVTAIALTTGNANSKPHLIINVYKPCDKIIIPELHEYLRNHINVSDYGIIIVGGDFNTHHPVWNPEGYERHDEEADALVDMMAELELTLLLPPGTVTYPNGGTTIDLVWGSSEAANRIIKCRIAKEHDHGSDHLPIETTIAMRIEEPQFLPPYNYAKTNWKELNTKLELYLPSMIQINDEAITEVDVDNYAELLINAITKAVQETTPRKRPSPHSKRWWTEELSKLRKEANRLRNIFRRTNHAVDKAAWRAKTDEYAQEIARARPRKWREYANSANRKTIWQIKRYITNIPTSTFVPTLNDHAATNEQKVSVLRKAFFPKPPPADLTDISSTVYPQEVPFEAQITVQQIREAVNRLAPDKAPGPDEISNRVLKNALPVIEHHLLALMQVSMRLGHFPKPFKHTTTVVLRKPSRPDYTKVKAYRPIALENTLGKVMESVIAEIISYLTETHELLPPHHYGGRPGRSAEDAMMIMSENIYQAWKEKKIYTAIFMDVAGAFNNVHHERLIHNLRKRRIPHSISLWIASFLRGRSTQLQFNGSKSEHIPTPAGVPQGSPLSPLLYMFYNADLLDIAQQHRATGLGFIDDIVYGVQGNSDQENTRKLKHILNEAEEWRKKHGAQFEISKYILVHYTRNRNVATKASVIINGVRIEPSNEAKYLGVIFDQELRFKTHLQHVVKKGTNAAMALSGIAKTTWGVPYTLVRQLFQAVIAPRTDYAAIIWHRPKGDGSTAGAVQTRKLTTIQRLAMKAILGCFRTTPTAAMELETGLQPAWIRLQSKVLLASTRMQSLSSRHPIQEWLTKALRTRTACISHRSNLENILQQFPYMCTKIETIEPYIRPPWWTPITKIKIETTKVDAKDQHNKIQMHLDSATTATIYTDGSGIESKIGAAAYNSMTNEVSHQYLGSEKQFNVYAAELTALHLAVKQLWNHGECRIGRIYTDSQAGVKAIVHPRRQSGQTIIQEILNSIDKLTDEYPQLQVEIVWIPGHAEIEGNERADTEAKKAALDLSLSRPHHYKPLKSARARHIKAVAKEQWDKAWRENTKTALALRRITKEKYTKTGPAIYREMANRNGAVKIAQLRTGHCGLNSYLFRFGIKNSPYCRCGYGKETVEHYLLECRNYSDQRKKLRREVGAGRMRVARLLGDTKMINNTLEFINGTGRLEL